MRLILTIIWTAALPGLALAQSTSTVAEELVVTGSRVREKLTDTTVATELVDGRAIEQSGAENLTELLEEQPGVELERLARGTGIRLMGLDPEHVLILVDGERVSGRVGGGIDPTRLTLENVEQVEIVKGAGSAIYGSEAIGGVINIISRDPTKLLEASARGTYGMFNTVDADASAGGRLGPVSTLFTGGYHRSDGFTLESGDEDKPNLQTTGPGFDGWDLSNSTIFALGTDARVRLRGEYHTLSQRADDQFGTTRVSLREQTQSSWLVSVLPEILFGERGRFKANLNISHFDFDIAQQAGPTRDHLFQTVGTLSFQIDDEVIEHHLFSIGLEGILEQQGGTTTAVDEDDTPITRDFFAGGTQSRQRAAVYIQDNWTPLDGDGFYVSVVPSIRVDIDSQFGSVATPRFAIRYDPISEIALRLSYGLGFRAPGFEELYVDFINRGSNYVVQGNRDLEPERSQAFNLTGTVRPWDWIGATGTFYYINLDHLIDTEDLGLGPDNLTIFRYVNVESARSTGAEASLDIDPIDELGIGLGYVFNATRDRATDRPLSGRARHKATVRVSFNMEAWGLSATLRSQIYGTRIFFRDEDGDGVIDRLPQKPYATLDFRVEKTLFGWFSLFAGFENLLDAGDPGFTPITPRSFYGGLSAHYELDGAGESSTPGGPS